MSRTDKDLPWYLGGQRHRYGTSEKGHARFTRWARRSARGRAKSDIRKGKEPDSRYPVEKTYFD